jgi:hypothetical protein
MGSALRLIRTTAPGLSTTVRAVRVTASFSDVGAGGSNIAAGEGFLDTVGATGTGFVFVAQMVASTAQPKRVLEIYHSL